MVTLNDILKKLATAWRNSTKPSSSIVKIPEVVNIPRADLQRLLSPPNTKSHLSLPDTGLLQRCLWAGYNDRYLLTNEDNHRKWVQHMATAYALASITTSLTAKKNSTELVPIPLSTLKDLHEYEGFFQTALDYIREQQKNRAAGHIAIINRQSAGVYHARTTEINLMVKRLEDFIPKLTFFLEKHPVTINLNSSPATSGQTEREPKP